MNFSNDPGTKCSRNPPIKAYGLHQTSLPAPGVATKQWQPLAKSRPWSPWQFVGILLCGKNEETPALGVGGTPLKTSMSPENQWLEDVFHT